MTVVLVALTSPALTLYAGLFTWSFLAATILPLSSEAPLAALVYQRREWVIPVAVATLGNVLGACTTYALARWAADAAGVEAGGGRMHGRATRLVSKYGAPALLLSWVPIVGDVLVAVAGAAACRSDGSASQSSSARRRDMRRSRGLRSECRCLSRSPHETLSMARSATFR